MASPCPQLAAPPAPPRLVLPSADRTVTPRLPERCAVGAVALRGPARNAYRRGLANFVRFVLRLYTSGKRKSRAESPSSRTHIWISSNRRVDVTRFGHSAIPPGHHPAALPALRPRHPQLGAHPSPGTDAARALPTARAAEHSPRRGQHVSKGGPPARWERDGAASSSRPGRWPFLRPAQRVRDPAAWPPCPLVDTHALTPEVLQRMGRASLHCPGTPGGMWLRWVVPCSGARVTLPPQPGPTLGWGDVCHPNGRSRTVTGPYRIRVESSECGPYWRKRPLIVHTRNTPEPTDPYRTTLPTPTPATRAPSAGLSPRRRIARSVEEELSMRMHEFSYCDKIASAATWRSGQ